MQATSVQDAQIRTLLPEKNECLSAVLRLGRIHTMFLGLVFYYGGFSSWPTWRCPPDVDTLEKKLGRASSVEQILDIASRVVRMICRATHLPRGERQFYTRRGNSDRPGRIDDLLFKEANPTSFARLG
jgi:hypothetical protein